MSSPQKSITSVTATDANPWAGRTKDRLVARPTVDSSPDIERRVNLAVARAKEGDRDAIRFLYLRYADNVFGYVRTIVRHHHDAEDVTQQVFAKLITAIAKYEPRSVPFIGWLLRLSHNVAVDHLRRQRATPTAEVFGADERCDEDSGDRAQSLRTALESLPEDQRAVVMLRHVHGLSPTEIAGCLGRTPGSVYGLHHRGRRALCEELARLESVPQTARSRRAVAA
jgi:RNA polymerase sigma-70 factor (ECF subfamily)